MRVIGLGDNVVDMYMHRNVMYPGGNAMNFAVYANLMGGIRIFGCLWLG